MGDGDADAEAEGLGDAEGLGEALAVNAGRLPTDSTTTCSADCQRMTPRYSTMATMTARLAQKTTRLPRDLFTSES